MTHIKRPNNSFMVWAKEMRPIVCKSNPTILNTGISVLLGRIWTNMTESQKKTYKQKSIILNLEHKLQYPYYKYTPRKFTHSKVIGKTVGKENINKYIKNKKIKKKYDKKILSLGSVLKKNTSSNSSTNTFTNTLSNTSTNTLIGIEEPDYFSEVQMFYEKI